MFSATILQDPHGHTYKLHGPGDPVIVGELSCKQFSNAIEAQSFIRSLRVPMGYWDDLVHRCGPMPSHCANKEDHIGELLASGHLKLYPVMSQAKQQATAKDRTIKTRDGKRHQFMDAGAKLSHDRSALKEFSKADEAHAYLDKLGMDEKQLKAMAKSLDVSLPATAVDGTAVTAAIAKAMAAKQIVVVVKDTTSVPKQEAPAAAPGSSAGHVKMDSAGAAPVAAEVVEKKTDAEEEKKPECKRQSFKVSCRHGRTVEVTPDTKHMPTLAVVSSTKKMLDEDKQQLLDQIIIESDISDICGTHKKGHLKTTDNSGEIVDHEKEGVKAVINTPSEKVSLHFGFLKYLWMDNITPRRFEVNHASCDKDKLKNAGSGVAIEVYPNVQLVGTVHLGMGSGSAKIVEDSDKKGAFKKELSKKRFSFGGSLKLIQEDNQPEISTEFLDTVKDTVSEIESVSNALQDIIGKFDEGRKPAIEITWPNFAVEFSSKIAEKNASPSEITRDFSVKFKADPFIKLSGEVDILPILLSPLLGGAVGKNIIDKLLENMEEGWGSEESWAHLKAKASIILSLSGELKAEFGVEGSNKTVTAVTGVPVEFSFGFEAKGEIKVDGHLLKVKIEIVAGIGIKSSIDVGLEFKDDETGLYWKPKFMFNGIKAYIEGAAKPEKDIKGEKKSSTGFNPLAKTATVKAHPKEHVWISPRKVDFDKRYIAKY